MKSLICPKWVCVKLPAQGDGVALGVVYPPLEGGLQRVDLPVVIPQSTNIQSKPKSGQRVKLPSELSVADVIFRPYGIEVIITPVRAPKANAICERLIRSVRRECLDHMLILNERHLFCLIDDYVSYYNHARPHQGLDQHIPVPVEEDVNRIRGSDQKIVSYPVLGGLHHDYRRAA